MATGIECVSECTHPRFKYLKKMTQLEKEDFLKSFDVVFCDLDGVIWRVLGEGLPGSSTAINFLRSLGKKVSFVTNNSIVPIQLQLQKFKSCNIETEQDDIIYPARTICDYLKSKNFKDPILCIASTPFKDVLRNAGFELLEEVQHEGSESMQKFHAAIYRKEPAKAVIIDVDFHLTATKLMSAHIYLKDPEVLFIAGAADELIPFGGSDIIGSGPFINVVEKASNREALVLGKPGMGLCRVLNDRFNLENRTNRALFIGDSLTSDVKFAKMCGFQTLIVLTGGTEAKDLHTPRPDDEIPDFVTDSLKDLSELL